MRLASTGLHGRKASAHVAAMPPTRLGHIRMSSIQPGVAAQLRTSPMMSSGTAALPCASTRAPIRKRLWFDPPIASAVAPGQPSTRGWVPLTGVADILPPDRAANLERGLAEGVRRRGPRPRGRPSGASDSGAPRRSVDVWTR